MFLSKKNIVHFDWYPVAIVSVKASLCPHTRPIFCVFAQKKFNNCFSQWFFRVVFSLGNFFGVCWVIETMCGLVFSYWDLISSRSLFLLDSFSLIRCWQKRFNDKSAATHSGWFLSIPLLTERHVNSNFASVSRFSNFHRISCF